MNDKELRNTLGEDSQDVAESIVRELLGEIENEKKAKNGLENNRPLESTANGGNGYESEKTKPKQSEKIPYEPDQKRNQKAGTQNIESRKKRSNNNFDPVFSADDNLKAPAVDPDVQKEERLDSIVASAIVNGNNGNHHSTPNGNGNKAVKNGTISAKEKREADNIVNDIKQEIKNRNGNANVPSDGNRNANGNGNKSSNGNGGYKRNENGNVNGNGHISTTPRPVNRAPVPIDEEDEAPKSHKVRNALLITFGSILLVLIGIYVGFALYFKTHFEFYTSLNGLNVTMQSVEDVKNGIRGQVADYSIIIEEADSKTETLAGKDIDLKYVDGDEIQNLLDSQNSWLWPEVLWNHSLLSTPIGLSYDKDLFTEKIRTLECMDLSKQVDAIDAKPVFEDTKFEIESEKAGTQLDTSTFVSELGKAIMGFSPSVNLVETGCYVQPRFTSESKEVIEACDELNSYLGAEITLDFDPYTEVVDAAVISQWLSTDPNMGVVFDEDAIGEYVAELAEKYDTKGKDRNFVTANGNTVTVSGGYYGWELDQETEVTDLTENIKNKDKLKREPAYLSKAASHGEKEWGDTYAEVDLSSQHMWFFKDGELVVESDVVTGNPNKGNATPQGWYSIYYTASPAVLRGRRLSGGGYEYETPVKYWMPFNNGIGFHDATWQPSFGGNRYTYGGSHGCVNMPYAKAQALYAVITAGTPVICHY
ncbi:MAG: L,D-transpeptidase/peptidoglycan binding protein [Lachnospiraceae bacterium]|nr:L,D-transpeptidase/peptidoglycan binding protein [Lachnospiraceae bacterium]